MFLEKECKSLHLTIYLVYWEKEPHLVGTTDSNFKISSCQREKWACACVFLILLFPNSVSFYSLLSGKHLSPYHPQVFQASSQKGYKIPNPSKKNSTCNQMSFLQKLWCGMDSIHDSVFWIIDRLRVVIVDAHRYNEA